MTLGAHVPAPPSPEKHQEEVEEGDSVTIFVKGEMVEAAVMKKRGLQVHLLFEDNETKKWADATELKKVVKGGAEELMSRAARAAAAREEAEQEKRRKAEEAARLKAEQEAKEAARKAEEKRIRDAFMARARKAFDWLPTGVYFNTDHLPIPDHQKDIFRIVWYEADNSLNFKRQGKPKFPPNDETCGCRVFYTDGTYFPTNWVGEGSADGVLKGDGCGKQLAEELEVCMRPRNPARPSSAYRHRYAKGQRRAEVASGLRREPTE